MTAPGSRTTRDKLLADPKSGASSGAARGGRITGRRQGGAYSTAFPPTVESQSSLPPEKRVRQPSGPRTVPAKYAGQTAAPASSAVGRGGTVATITHQGAGLVVAAFAWPLAVNLLKGGPSRMWDWVKAKFINQTAGAAIGGSAAIGAPDTSGVGTAPSRAPGAYHGHQPSLGRKKG